MTRSRPRHLRDVRGTPLLTLGLGCPVRIVGDPYGWQIHGLSSLGESTGVWRMYATRAGVIEDMLADLGLTSWGDLRLVRCQGRECYIQRSLLSALGLTDPG